MNILIVFGIRSSKIKQRRLEGETTCRNCGAKNSYLVSGKASYFHFFWFITFPWGKRLVFVCDQCDDVVRPHEPLPESIANTLETTDKVKNPGWHYIGVVLIVFALIGFVLFSISNSMSMAKVEDSWKEQYELERVEDSLRNADIAAVIINPSFEVDSIANRVLQDVPMTDLNFNLDEIGFLTKQKNGKLLFVMKLIEEPEGYQRLMGQRAIRRIEDYLIGRYSEQFDEVFVVLTGLYSVLQTRKPIYYDDKYLKKLSPFGVFYDTIGRYDNGYKTEVKDFKSKKLLELDAKSKIAASTTVDAFDLKSKIYKVAKKKGFKIPEKGEFDHDDAKYVFLYHAHFELPESIATLEKMLQGEGYFISYYFIIQRIESARKNFYKWDMKTLRSQQLNTDKGKLQPFQESPYWINFYNDNYNSYYLDMMPGKNGVIGQVFWIGQNDVRKVVAKDMIEFFDRALKEEIPMRFGY